MEATTPAAASERARSGVLETRPLRVAVVGARRVRQGTGPFLARHARACGAEVRGVIGTSLASAEAARAELAPLGLSPRADTRLEGLLRNEPLDVLIVASPAGTHAPWLHAALRAGLHVLCEKPLLAGPGDSDAALRAGAREAAALAEAFAARSLALSETCQWTHTLPVFWLLHGSRDLDGVRRFEMVLQPVEPARRGWLESLPHPLSLLQAVAPGSARVEDPRHERSGGGEILSFTFAGGTRRIRASVEIRPRAETPRRAEYALDGRWLHRRVDPSGQAVTYETGPPVDRSWRTVDPMKIAVRAFLARVAALHCGEPALADAALVQRQELLAALLAACPVA